MLAQIRVYTINRNQMDAFLANFREVVLPMHDAIGLPVASTYVNRPQNEFIWVRTFTDAADREAKLKAFSDKRTELGVQLGENIAKMEVTEVEYAFEPAATSAL